MLEAFYATERGSLEDATINGDFDLHQDLVWVDLIAPSQEEQQWIMDAYEQNLPTLKSLEDISSSARFYRDDDGILHISTYFLTKNKNYQVEEDTEDQSSILATVQTVAFILHKDRLFTLRGEKLVAFRAFRARARRNDYEIDYKDPTWILLGLLEAKLDELADILEDVHKDLEKYSTEVLNNRHREQILDLDDMITRLAQLEDILFIGYGKKGTSCFMQVGGKLEPNEAPEVTIVREIQEEICCQAEVQQFVGRFETKTANEPDHQLVSYVYLVKLDQMPKIEAEIAEMKWIDLNEQDLALAPLTTEIVIPWVKSNLLAQA